MPSGFFKFDRFTRLVLLADAAPPHIALSARGRTDGFRGWVSAWNSSAQSSVSCGPRSQIECATWAPKSGRARPVGPGARPSTSRGPRSQAERVLRAPKPDRVRDVGSEVRPSTSCGLRSQAERVLRALKPGRVRDVAPKPGRVLDVPGLECIVVRSLRSKLTESRIA